MKKVYLSLYFLCLLFSCTKEESRSTLTGTWRLIAYKSPENSTLETEPPGLNQSIEISFADDGHTGTISGHTVSNQVFGMYTLQPGYRLTITDFYALTKVGEPEWGNRFWESFPQAGFYEAYSNKLVIHYDQNRAYMLFERT